MDYGHVPGFASNWPRYSSVLRQAAVAVKARSRDRGQVLLRFRQGRARPPQPEQGGTRDRATLITRGIGSLYALFWKLPHAFLSLFHAGGKREVWHGTLQLFPVSRRTQVKETLKTCATFCVTTDRYEPVALMGSRRAAALLVLGSRLPDPDGHRFGIAEHGALHWRGHGVAPGFHDRTSQKMEYRGSFRRDRGGLDGDPHRALNFVAPQLVGRRVRLNAVAIHHRTAVLGLGLGGMGLVLAIPITAALRVICDHTESWNPSGTG